MKPTTRRSTHIEVCFLYPGESGAARVETYDNLKAAKKDIAYWSNRVHAPWKGIKIYEVTTTTIHKEVK